MALWLYLVLLLGGALLAFHLATFPARHSATTVDGGWSAVGLQHLHATFVGHVHSIYDGNATIGGYWQLLVNYTSPTNVENSKLYLESEKTCRQLVVAHPEPYSQLYQSKQQPPTVS